MLIVLSSVLPSPSPTAIAMAPAPTIAMAYNGVRHFVYTDGYCVMKSPIDIVPITWRLPQDSLRQFMGGFLTGDDHALFPVGMDATTMVHTVLRPS